MRCCSLILRSSAYVYACCDFSALSYHLASSRDSLGRNRREHTASNRRNPTELFNHVCRLRWLDLNPSSQTASLRRCCIMLCGHSWQDAVHASSVLATEHQLRSLRSWHIYGSPPGKRSVRFQIKSVCTTCRRKYMAEWSVSFSFNGVVPTTESWARQSCVTVWDCWLCLSLGCSGVCVRVVELGLTSPT